MGIEIQTCHKYWVYIYIYNTYWVNKCPSYWVYNIYIYIYNVRNGHSIDQKHDLHSVTFSTLQGLAEGGHSLRAAVDGKWTDFVLFVVFSPLS